VILRATVQDNSVPPQAIPGEDLTTATFTLYTERSTGLVPYAIINGRDHVNIKDQIDAQGQLTLTLTAEDMAIVDGKSEEFHRALIEWAWASSQRGSWEVRIIVHNVHRVPTV
jgi:hypothetical protein